MWEKFCVESVKDDKPPIITWERMRKLIREKFLPKDYKQQLFVKLQNCQQGAKTVEDYLAEFSNLVARNQLQESEEQLVSRFREGLNRFIKLKMSQVAYTMVEAVQQAIYVEHNIGKTITSTIISLFL